MDFSPDISMQASATNVTAAKRAGMRERLNRSLELDREKSALQRQGDTQTAAAGLQTRCCLRLSNRALFIWVEPRHSSRNSIKPDEHWRILPFESPACLAGCSPENPGQLNVWINRSRGKRLSDPSVDREFHLRNPNPFDHQCVGIQPPTAQQTRWPNLDPPV